MNKPTFENPKNSRSLVPAVRDYVDERATSSGKAKNSPKIVTRDRAV